MAVFAYKALEGNATVRGTVSAETPRQARDLLRDRGLTIERVDPHHPHREQSTLPRLSFRRRGGWGGREVVGFTRELSTLLGVGIPLLEALDTILRQHHGSFHADLLALRDRVAAGESLAGAMRQQPAVFDELCVSMAEVGENSGTLDETLERLADFKEASAGLKNRVATALIYPAIVLVMAVGVTLFLMTFVVPQLLAGLIEAGRPLPWPTRVVKALSDGLLNWWWLIALVVVAFFIGIGLVLRSPRGRWQWHRLQLRLPIVGEMVRRQSLLRTCVTLSSLLKSGVVFDRALQIAQRSTPNLVIRDALVRCERAVQSGRDIGAALEATEVFPPLVVQVFRVGQQSGRLEEMLDRLARDYDASLTLAATRLTALLEPVLILFLVAIVGLVAFATVLPILEAGNVLQ